MGEHNGYGHGKQPNGVTVIVPRHVAEARERQAKAQLGALALHGQMSGAIRNYLEAAVAARELGLTEIEAQMVAGAQLLIGEGPATPAVSDAPKADAEPVPAPDEATRPEAV